MSAGACVVEVMGEAGVVVVSGADEGQDILSSRCAGLSRSTVTESVRPFREIVKNLLLRLTTGKGPSYGGRKGLRTPSQRTKTCVAVANSAET